MKDFGARLLFKLNWVQASPLIGKARLPAGNRGFSTKEWLQAQWNKPCSQRKQQKRLPVSNASLRRLLYTRTSIIWTICLPYT